MTTKPHPAPPAELLDKSSYTIKTLEDEIRVDQLCCALLKKFHRSLLEEQQLDPLDAGSQAAGADYFLRNFVIDNRRGNIFEVTDKQVRCFAGHWYITSNLEPNLVELTAMLNGVASFYRFCAASSLVGQEVAAAIEQTCNDLAYYQNRIDSFHSLSGDGFMAWGKECPLS